MERRGHRRGGTPTRVGATAAEMGAADRAAAGGAGAAGDVARAHTLRIRATGCLQAGKRATTRCTASTITTPTWARARGHPPRARTCMPGEGIPSVGGACRGAGWSAAMTMTNDEFDIAPSLVGASKEMLVGSSLWRERAPPPHPRFSCSPSPSSPPYALCWCACPGVGCIWVGFAVERGRDRVSDRDGGQPREGGSKSNAGCQLFLSPTEHVREQRAPQGQAR